MTSKGEYDLQSFLSVIVVLQTDPNVTHVDERSGFAIRCKPSYPSSAGKWNDFTVNDEKCHILTTPRNIFHYKVKKKSYAKYSAESMTQVGGAPSPLFPYVSGVTPWSQTSAFSSTCFCLLSP